MLDPVSGWETLLYKTVRLVCDLGGGEAGFGTGFFYQHWLSETRFLPLIVTNRHVVDGALSCSLHMHAGEDKDGRRVPAGSTFQLSISDGAAGFIGHPDPDIDLCALPLHPIAEQLQTANQPPIYLSWLSDKNIPTADELAEFDAVEDAYMVGYPNGLWDEVHNFPIIRRGVTATHPAVRFNGKSVTVVDMACIPGSSGSPVVVPQAVARAKRPAFYQNESLMFLGVLFAGPMMTREGRVEVRPIPTSHALVASTLIPINLGYVIKSYEVAALGEHIAASRGPRAS